MPSGRASRLIRWARAGRTGDRTARRPDHRASPAPGASGIEPSPGDHVAWDSSTGTTGSTRRALAPMATRLLPLSHRQEHSRRRRTVCLWSRRPRRPRSPTGVTNIRGVPTTTPRPRPRRRTDADRTDRRQTQRHEAGRRWPTPSSNNCRAARPPRSASRSVSACWSTPSGRPANSASCNGACEYGQAASSGDARGRRLHA